MKNLIIYFCLACLSVILFSCEKYISSRPQKIIVKSLNDTAFYQGSEFSIYGESFTVSNSYDVHLGDNMVLKAVKGNDTSLMVVLPDTIALGTYQVWLSPSFQGGSKFKIEASEKLQLSVIADDRVELTSISTPLLQLGLLKISGFGFSTNLASNTIFVGDTQLKPTVSSIRTLECPLPATIAEGEHSIKVTVIRDSKEYTSNIMTLNVVPKIITIDALSTPVATIGGNLVITGKNISAKTDDVSIKLGETTFKPTSVTTTSVSLTIPTSVTEGNYDLKIVSEGKESNAIPLQIVSGSFSYLTSADTTGKVLTINGSGFSNTASVVLNDTEYPATTVTKTKITFKLLDDNGLAKVPNGEYTVKVKVNGIESVNSKTITVNIPIPPAPAPSITTAVYDATTFKITLTGEHFGTDMAAVTVTITATDEVNNPTTVTVESVNDTEIVVVVDPALNDGNYSINVAIGGNGATASLTVETPPIP